MADNFITFEDLELDDSFSFEEDCFINLMWQSMVVKRIAKRLGRSDKEVRERIRKLGVREDHDVLPFYYNNFILYYVKKYMNDFNSATSLAEFLGFDSQVVLKAIRILNCRDKSSIKRKYNDVMNARRKNHDIKQAEQKRSKELFAEYYGHYPCRYFAGAIGMNSANINNWKKYYSRCCGDKYHKRILVLIRPDIYPVVQKLLDCEKLDEVKALVDRETA